MEYSRFIVQVFVGALSPHYEALSIEVSKQTSAQEIINCITERLGLPNPQNFQLAEVIGNNIGEACKERRLGPTENPVALQMIWPQASQVMENRDDDLEHHEYRFCLREKMSSDSIWAEHNQLDSQLIRDYFYKFLYQPKDKEYPDLCQLPNLNEQTLLENLRARFQRGYIYTYVGSILISVNPFKYYPIYNPKYVKLYQNHRLGELPPHIFAIADAAYHSMLKQKRNQCIVISGESGSGKTESTLFLLHHLTMLSQKGSHGSGVEQTILSSGPVLEAFGNAKTAHNNNSSRFGKFIQVSYKENGLVQGASVQKYLLEKSRICSQGHNERSYHVFYYLLAGASHAERQQLQLLKPSDYRYLNQSKCYTIEGCDEQFEFVRLKQSMEMVGFTPDKQHRLFAILSAVLLIGNVDFMPKKSTYHHDESVIVRNSELVNTISTLLGVSQDTLLNALTSKKARVQGETLVMHYRIHEALAARDALAKSLYAALFDWIVLQVNYSLISLKESSSENYGNYIGVLDIFGFEDFGSGNGFEQYCINFANEHLQHYFNLHVFEYEQEEYRREGISWTTIEFTNNVDCLALIEGKPSGLLCILDDQCSFPAASNETFLQKINSVHKDNQYYEIPQRREAAFIIKHYAGRVKYQVHDFREKNLDLMRPEVISVLKNSRFSTVREVAGADPVAVFRWAILRAFFRAVSAFQAAGGRHCKRKESEDPRKPTKQKINIDNSRILAAIENTQNRLRKTRHSRSRTRSHGPRHTKNLKTVKALAQKALSLSAHGRLPGSRKPPHTVTGQFQLSLQSLMETLNTANPYFIRCIKSNANKEANVFDNDLVMRQLRYTGMLETVRIRQAGFNVRLSYDEFIHHYRILLSKGLLSSQLDVKEFLYNLQLEKSEYELGHSKIFMRESQKEKLDAQLHQTILTRIIIIQRWYRSIHQRRTFILLRAAVVRIQCCVRMWIAQKMLGNLRMRHQAATYIQKMWRGMRVRRWYKNLRRIVISLQAHARGSQFRERYQTMQDEWRVRQEVRRKTLEEEETSTSSVNTITTLASTDSQASASTQNYQSLSKELPSQKPLPPRRRSHTINSSRKLEQRPSENFLPLEAQRRQSVQDTPSRIHPEIGRRLSETSLLTNRHLQRNALVQIHGAGSEEGLGSVSPPSSPTRLPTEGGLDFYPDTVLDKDTHRNTKSFRHRKYPKAPLSAGRSTSESDDCLSYESSQPQTPTTPSEFKFTEPNFTASAATHEAGRGGVPGSQGASSLDLRNADSTDIQNLKLTTSLPSVCASFSRPIFSPLSVEGLGGGVSQSQPSILGEDSTTNKAGPTSQQGASDSEVLKQFLTMSPHNLKQSTLLKGEICASCTKPFTSFFINTGYKCIGCRRVFHSKCVEHSIHVVCAESNFSKENSSPATKKQKWGKGGDKGTDKGDLEIENKWNLTRTSEFIDKSDDVIRDARELIRLEEFIAKKLRYLEDKQSEKHDRTQSLDRSYSRQETPHKESESSFRIREKKDNQVDQMFFQSLREFKSNLVSTYSVAHSKEANNMSLKYKDLTKNFEQVMNKVCKDKVGDSAFPVTMGINAFRGFLDEFIREKRKKPVEKPKRKKKRPKKRHKKHVEVKTLLFGSHTFVQMKVNIPTQCEVCNLFLWLSNDVLTCQRCKLTCHEKCYKRIELQCSNEGPRPLVVDGEGIRNRVFKVPLENLIRTGEKIPGVIERLITSIELYGLYTEGLYRKPGAQTKVKAVKAAIEADPAGVDFSEISVHVLATILKFFFREMPEPLLTYEAYDPLLHAAELQDPEDKLQTTFSILKSLPKLNYDILERLIFHMARVAQHEEHNRMSCNALAIVFAPCILRNQRPQTVQDSLNDISKQTQVVELVVRKQLQKVRATLQDIDTVDNEKITAGHRLEELRNSQYMRHRSGAVPDNDSSSLPRRISFTSPLLSQDFSDPVSVSEYDLEEKLLDLEDTRETLAFELPLLIRVSSEEDMLSTDMSRQGSLEDVSTMSSFGTHGAAYSVLPSSRHHRNSGGDETDSPFYSQIGDQPVRKSKRPSVSNSETIEEDPSGSSRSQPDYSDDAVMV